MSNDPRSPFSQHHPLAGKIFAGVRTTENRARPANTSMHLGSLPQITMADMAQQMFSFQDKKGTRVYYATNGIFNTVDEKGTPITFIGGLYKTMPGSVCDFLQQFVDKGFIHYLELKEEPEDATAQESEPSSEPSSPEYLPGGSGYDSQSLQQHEQESSDAGQADPTGSRSGGEPEQADAEQPSRRTAVSSSSGIRNDIPVKGLEEPPRKISLRDKLKAG